MNPRPFPTIKEEYVIHPKITLSVFLSAVFAFGIQFQSNAQELAPANYDEALVPQFTLPDPLIAEDGSPISSPEEWKSKRRPEILKLFKEHMFGEFPEANSERIKFQELRTKTDALGGIATQKEVKIYFDYPNESPQVTVLIFIPNDRQVDVPVFIAPNFQGNHSTTDEESITIVNPQISNSKITLRSSKTRGNAKSRWPFEMIVKRGYAIATLYYEEIEPDTPAEFQYGAHSIFTNFAPSSSNYPAAIGAWAWGLSRVLDCLKNIDGIDANRAVVFGHSRLGKTALWCGANDERFAAVISNDSGCGGAALSRREFGERVDIINKSFPHWFTSKFHEYGSCVNDLPIDQHELIALIAPRPVYVASAIDDQWADPKGEFLSSLYADPVYRLLGTEGFGGVTEFPDVNVPVGRTIRYHIRSGKHDVTDYDWEQYLNFADDVFDQHTETKL